MKSLAKQLQEELMEKYGLREDQVRVNITIYTPDLEEGRRILSDFDKHKLITTYFKNDNDPCDFVYGEDIHEVTIHRRDGFYGEYVTEKEKENA